jgi:enoyl-[acyl-carrier protein] reductase I
MAEMLSGRRILVTGVTTHRSIAFAVAREAQAEGAEIVLTTFGRRGPMTERAASRLDRPPPVLELDVRRQEDIDTVAADLQQRWGGLDGLVHSIAFSPPEALEGDFRSAPNEAVIETLETSALSLNVLAAALAPLLEQAHAGSIVGLDFDASVAWPGYGWMGVAKAGLESICRYLAHELGPRGIRVNLVAAGPLHTVASRAYPGFSTIAERWPKRAPLGWDADDCSGVAQAVCFFLSNWSRQVSGEILHVDGGHHAIGAP